ncbi:histidine kinase-like ATPase [Lactarius psammicola]|nr:histidine kinase-like ATPase [Lactarius psammicola]
MISPDAAAEELVENSLGTGATNIEVLFRDHGLKSFGIIDNGCGIAPEYYEPTCVDNHHFIPVSALLIVSLNSTDTTASFSDLTSVFTFDFRGGKLSSLCALSESVSATTVTSAQPPTGTIFTFDSAGCLTCHRWNIASQRGNTVAIMGLFTLLPVRPKELERHAKPEFRKALHIYLACTLVPCASENSAVFLTTSNTPDGGCKSVQLRADRAMSIGGSVGALEGPNNSKIFLRPFRWFPRRKFRGADKATPITINACGRADLQVHSVTRLLPALDGPRLIANINERSCTVMDQHEDVKYDFDAAGDDSPRIAAAVHTMHAEADGRGRVYCAREHERAAAERVEAALEEDRPAGRRLGLVVQPVSKNAKFDIRVPLGALVKDTCHDFAMRACRRNTMAVELLKYQIDDHHNSVHGNDGATMELPAHAADDETSVRRWHGGEEELRPVDWATFIPR